LIDATLDALSLCFLLFAMPAADAAIDAATLISFIS